MNRVHVESEVVVPMRQKSKTAGARRWAGVLVFGRRAASGIAHAWNEWDRRWREQALRGAEMERIRVREQARLEERMPITRWYGHF